MDQLEIVPNFTRENRQTFLKYAFPDLGYPRLFQFETTYRMFGLKAPRKVDIVREILRIFLFRRLSWSQDERETNWVGYNNGDRPKTYSPFVNVLARFIIAVGGGASLIVPMLIMSFNASRTKSLVTVAVAVMLFALSLSLGFLADNKDILTATATYAAVLVVFVGTSGIGP